MTLAGVPRSLGVGQQRWWDNLGVRTARYAVRLLHSGYRIPILTRAAHHRTIFLTIDDGPSPRTTPRLLELLNRYGVTAAFFLNGQRAASHPQLVADIAAAGHEIYSHGLNHLKLNSASRERIYAELDQAEQALRVLRPTPSPYMVRLPYGAGHDTLRIQRLLREWRTDCVIAHWGYSLEDFQIAENCDNQPELARRCTNIARTAVADRRFGGSVVLMHEDPIGIESPLSPLVAPILLGEILALAAREGVAFARLASSLPSKTMSRLSSSLPFLEPAKIATMV